MCCVGISSCTGQDLMPSKICKAILPGLSSTAHAHLVTQLACALQQDLCCVLHERVYSALGKPRTLQKFGLHRCFDLSQTLSEVCLRCCKST